MAYVVALLSLVVGLLVVLVIGLLRSHAEILRSLHDLGAYADGRDQPVGTQRLSTAPSVVDLRPDDIPSHLVGTTPDGETTAVPISATVPTLLAFLTSGCVTCASFWDAFGAGKRVAGLRAVVVTRGVEAESAGAVAALAPAGLTTIMSSAAWDAFGVPGAPYFVHVEGGLVAGQGVAMSWDQLLGMLGRAAEDAAGAGERLSRRDLLRSGRRRRSDRELPAS